MNPELPPESDQGADADPSSVNHLSDEESDARFVDQTSNSMPLVSKLVGEPPESPEPPHVDNKDESRSAPVVTATLSQSSPAPIAIELQNIAANGGAVGAVVLGAWSILCSLITPFSIINTFMAIGLGAYGLTSMKKTWAIIGIALGLVGGALSLIETNEILRNYFAEETATY